jgi:radial spoke head protein 4A
MRDWFKKGEGEADAMAIEEPVEEGGETAAIGFIPDIISENKHLYPWAGISLGEYGCLILQKSLKELCTKTGATNMRFWGKIRGTHADYFIAEGTSDAAPAEGGEDNEGGARGDLEARGEGVNVYSYWVTNSPENKSWVLLPDLKPEDLDAARGARVQFTGNLNKKIYTNPFFFKAEQYLLRA